MRGYLTSARWRDQALAATAQDVSSLTASAAPLGAESLDLSSQLGLDNIRQSLIRQACVLLWTHHTPAPR